MKVLVTGGLGFIGSHVVVQLINAGCDVTVIDNLANCDLTSIDRIENLSGGELEFHQVDVTDADGMGAVFERGQFDAVVHLAGVKSVSESEVAPDLYHRINVLGSLVLVDAMLKYRVKRLVFSSSATVYGVVNDSPLREADQPGALTNPYARTKAIVESMLKDYCNAFEQLEVVSLRYFNPIGAHETGRLGELPRGRPNNLFPFILQVASGDRPCLEVFGQDYATLDGTGVRDYIHIQDLALGHVSALKWARQGFEVFNLGTGEGYSVLQLISTFEEVTGVEIPFRIAARRPGDLASVFADVTKATNILGWRARYSLEDMCIHGWKWQKFLTSGRE